MESVNVAVIKQACSIWISIKYQIRLFRQSFVYMQSNNFEVIYVWYFNWNVFILNKMHASRHADKEVLISVNNSCTLFYGRIFANAQHYILYHSEKKHRLRFAYVRIMCLCK